MTDLINAAHEIAPPPATRDEATRDAWVRHYAAQALAAYATFRIEGRNLKPNAEPGSRPDLGYLILAAVASTTAVIALADPADAPTMIWDLTPEAGALNGEWEEWLDDVLVRCGVNPGHIDPDLDPADFTPDPSDQAYVCPEPECGETAYLHVPGCARGRSVHADPTTMSDRPRVVVLCGSTRFRTEMADVNRRETLAGRIVVAPGVFAHDGDTISDEEKANLDALHLRKIDLSGEVLVVSDEAGYFGSSTLGEIRYAVANGKPVRFAHPAAEERWNALTAQSDGGESDG